MFRGDLQCSMFCPRESLRTNGSRKFLVGSRRESSKLGRVGDQERSVVLEWQREGYCQTILTRYWTEELFCLTLQITQRRVKRGNQAAQRFGGPVERIVMRRIQMKCFSIAWCSGSALSVMRVLYTRRRTRTYRTLGSKSDVCS